MSAFAHDPAKYSYKTYNIGGITTHVYNSSVLEDYVKKGPVEGNDVPINVVYFVHGRTLSYKAVESIAYYLLDQIHSQLPANGGSGNLAIPYIAVAFDLRNHGSRTVDASANDGWGKGNLTHALDMASQIDGNVADLKLLIENLPIYLGLHKYLPTPQISTVEYSVKYRTILSGYSLGGHTILRFASKYPHLVDVINPVIGCADLSTLMVNRLRGEEEFDKKLFYFTYEELNLTPEQLALYPRELHDKWAAEDTAIFEEFPIGKVLMFASFGAQDKLVPPAISRLWADLYVNLDERSQVFEEQGIGHSATEEMVTKFAGWLTKEWRK